MFFFGKEKPNREVYKTAYWKMIDPLDRAHILLVAEGVKPMAYINFTNLKSLQEYLSKDLKIWITEVRGPSNWRPTRIRLFLPSRVYTICGSEKILQFLQGLWQSPNRRQYWDYEGKLLGYPSCCRQEYVAKTCDKKFNTWIIGQFGSRPYTFLIEAVRTLLENKIIPEEFLYRMPSQTPCSISCKPSLRLLRKWKKVLYKYDAEAAEVLKEFNQRCDLDEFQALVDKFKKKKISSEMFAKEYVFRF